jgi:DNA-3-methyladenine glycosylase I
MRNYHDKEWGVPLHNDRKIFEFMVLDAFQAGLSWKTVLHKRKNFERAFRNFDPGVVARFTIRDYESLLLDSGIIRNRQKIQASISNAKRFLEVQNEFDSFDKYIWGFVQNKPIVNTFKKLEDFPTKNELSDLISKDLVKRSFKFVGTTITYSFLEAAGLLNNHFYKCFRYQEIKSQQ